MRFSAALLSLACAVTSVIATPAAEVNEVSRPQFVRRDDIDYEVFYDDATGGKMEFKTNSGICETTKGVRTVSGYFSIGKNENMFFWFFQARNNPKTAPFAAWFNGGPGCSSMIGLFQEHGPCQFYGNDTEPSKNPYSWNEYANMIYVDQPIGVGFSYGKNDVTSTVTAAPHVWALLQAFFKKYPDYESRDFGLVTESYGGHYGPEFAHYIEQKNAAIKKGAKGEHINLVALAVNNGFYDALVQYPYYITYAEKNKYKKIITPAQAKQYMLKYNTMCKPTLAKCTSPTSKAQNPQCVQSANTCYQLVEGAITQNADFDVYDVREPAKDPFPPNTFVHYLNRPAVQKAIGVHDIKFKFCSNPPYFKFASTGDDSRPFLNTLSDVVQSGINVLLWAGDADYICNYMGGYAVVNKVDYAHTKEFASKKLAPYKVDGKEEGLFKTVGNLNWLQVYKAGHEVPYYQPKLSLQVFKQIMSKKPLKST